MSASPANSYPPAAITRSEWALIFVLMAIQFTHMVDFVIIMPLGERLRRELEITPSQFGYIVAAYAWAAGVASLLASFIMDRLDRKTVLLFLYAGFALSTLYCGLADDYQGMLLARTLAGVFGGLASVTIMAIIGDLFPHEKRGRASGAVMSAFAIASVAGLPIGLMLGEWYGRGTPFLALAGVSAVVWIVGLFRLPTVNEHLRHARPHPLKEFVEVIQVPNHLWAFAFTFFLVLGTFTVGSFCGPVFASINGWTEKSLAVVYLFAGLFTLIGMNIVGKYSDRVPRLPLFRGLALGSILMALIVTNLPPGPLWLATVALSGFMVLAAGRMVPAQAMLLGASTAKNRGAFMSLNTAIQHLGTGIAPAIAGALVFEDENGKLGGFPLVGLVAAGSALVSLVLAGKVTPAPHTLPDPIIEEDDELESGPLVVG